MIHLLTIDGGGVRGLIPAQVLTSFEAQLKHERNQPDAGVSDYFDLICGTSTGGLLALLLLTPDRQGRPLYAAEDAVKLYQTKSADIFKRSIWRRIWTIDGILGAKYSAKNLERIAHDAFGETTINDLLRPSLITTYDMVRNQPAFFSGATGGCSLAQNFYAADAARATSAAPTFFDIAEIRSCDNLPFYMVDGGVFANNPSMCALAEAFEQFGDIPLSEIKILSLGTGTKKIKHVNVTGSQGYAFWATDILSVLQNGVQEACHHQLETIYRSIRHTNNYLRIDIDEAELPKPLPEMDAASPEDIAYLTTIGKNLAKRYEERIDAFLKS